MVALPADPPRASSQSPERAARVERRLGLPDLATASLGWAAGALCCAFGALMLVAPHQLQAPSFAPFQAYLPAWGIGFLLAGGALLATILPETGRAFGLAAHAAAGLGLLIVASGLSAVGGWPGALSYGVLGAGTLLAPLVAGRRRPAQPEGGDLFSLLVGLGLVLSGLLMLVWPDLFFAAFFQTVRPYLAWAGTAFLAAGAGLAWVQLRPAPRVALAAASALGGLAGGTMLLFLVVALPTRVWSGTLFYGACGLAIILLPWARRRARGVDPASLRVRLALASVAVSALSVIGLTAVATDQGERQRVERDLLDQKALAIALARNVGDYLRLHQAAVATLAAQPGLLDLPPEAQRELLVRINREYPDAFVLLLLGEDGQALARSDGLPLVSYAEQPEFRAALQDNIPSFGVLVGPLLNRPILVFEAPVRDELGAVAGMAVAGLELARAAEVLAGAASGRGDAYLVDGAGRALVSPGETPVPALADLSARPPVAALLASGEAAGALRHGQGAQERLAGYARVAGPDWGVVVEQPMAEALATIRAGRDVAFGLLLAVIALAALVGAALASGLTAPLAALADAAGHLAARDAVLPLPRSHIAEVRKVAAAFGETRERLATSAAERERLLANEQAARTEAEATGARLRAIQRITDTALAHLDLDTLLHELLARLREQLRADTATILLLCDDGARLRVRAHDGLEAEASLAVEVPVGQGIAGRIASSRVPLVVPDLSAVEVVSPFLRAHVRSLVGVPLLVEDRLIGVLHVGARAARAFDDEDVRLLRLVADRAALAVERARLHEAAERRAAALEQLWALGQTFGLARGLQPTLDRIAEGARQLLDAERVSLALWEAEADRFTTTAWAGNSPPSRLVVPPGAGLMGTVALTRRSLLVDDYQVFPGRLPSVTDLTCAMAVPLLADEALVGMLSVRSTRPGRTFSPDDLRLLELLAQRAAVAVEETRLLDRLQRSLDDLLALHEAGQVLTSSLELDEVGQRVLGLAVRISGLQAGTVSLADERGRLRPWQSAGPAAIQAMLPRTGDFERIRRTALAAGEPRCFQVDSPERNGPPLVAWCLPLCVQGRAVGALDLWGPAPASERTAQVLGSLAYQAASAIENARLYRELAERERTLETLLARLVVAQEEERQRVAYEIHDGLAQVTAGAHQHLQAFARHYHPRSPQARAELDGALELARQAVREARRVIANLRPAGLDDFGLAATLRLEAEALEADGWEVAYRETLRGERLPPHVETALFRVGQEALNNVRKHAGPTKVRVALHRRGPMIRFEVHDHGQGFRPEQPPDRGGPGEQIGLLGMRERMAALGGRCVIRSRPGGGTHVLAEVAVARETRRQAHA